MTADTNRQNQHRTELNKVLPHATLCLVSTFSGQKSTSPPNYTFQGYFLYYPSRRNQPAALSALID
ncbi:MAG TPA: hypothetical protein VLL05_09985, partial [Terriglobales bacterium]|nr:hypothetical protein [Terriglobales bacterium]